MNMAVCIALLVTSAAIFIPLSSHTARARDSSDRKSIIEERLKFLEGVCIGICPKGPVGTEDIEDGAVTNSKLADDAVTTNKIADGAITAEKINGLQKLLCGSCSGTLPPIEPEATTWELLICDVPEGAQVGDKVVASTTVRGVPSPILVLSEIFHTQPDSRPLGNYLISAFVNGAEFSIPAQEVTVNYMIFNKGEHQAAG